jgi:hypothetical protein
VSLILLLLIIIAVFITLLFIEAFRIKLLLDTEKTAMNMTVFWLYPFFKVLINLEDSRPVMHFYLFNKHLFSKTVKKKKRKHNGMELVRITNPKDIYVNAKYGFCNPFTTGITCGAINIAQQFINIESFRNSPDFTTENDYIYFDASAKVNLGKAFINFLKQKKS